MLRTVLSDFEVKVLEQEPVEYRCGCSRDRIERALLSLGRDELSAILAEQGSCDLTCQFCDRVYHFSGPELEGLIQSLEKKRLKKSDFPVDMAVGFSIIILAVAMVSPSF